MSILRGSAQHIGARISQQDCFDLSDSEPPDFTAHAGFLAVVCDGMGGMEHGGAASVAAVREFLGAYRLKTPEEPIPAALDRSIHETNSRLLELAAGMGVVEGMGTTLIAAAIHGTTLHFVSVGDSALFLVRGGRVRTLNSFHVFANYLDRAAAHGTISQEDAQSHPGRALLTSFIGTETLEEVDSGRLDLQPGDTVLLATDGLFNTLSMDEIRAVLKGDPTRWADLLIARTLAKENPVQDNVSVVTLTLEPHRSRTA